MSNKEKQPSEIMRRYGDPYIWGIYFTLVLISVVESYSASSREVAVAGVYMPLIKQCMFLAMGGVLLWGIHRVDYNSGTMLLLLIPGLGMVTVLSMIYVLLFGEVINGAQRAISLMGFTIQPGEMAKLSIVTLLAYVLSRNQRNKDVSWPGVIISAVMVAVYGGLLIQSGLTTTLLLMCISFTMMIIGGTKVKKLLYVFLIYGVVIGCFWLIRNANNEKDSTLAQSESVPIVTMTNNTDSASQMPEAAEKGKVNRTGMRINRIKRLFNGDLLNESLTSENQQEMVSHMAQARGGLRGSGLGQSRESARLPLAFSDYIFSIIIEETGFIGGLFTLVLYLFLLARAAMVARRCRRALPALLVIGMASMIVYQALFHMAINVGVFPVSGQPLPLISKGGTSILVTSAALGIMLSVSRTIANYDKKSIKTEEAQLPTELRAENPTQLYRSNEWK